MFITKRILHTLLLNLFILQAFSMKEGLGDKIGASSERSVKNALKGTFRRAKNIHQTFHVQKSDVYNSSTLVSSATAKKGGKTLSANQQTGSRVSFVSRSAKSTGSSIKSGYNPNGSLLRKIFTIDKHDNLKRYLKKERVMRTVTVIMNNLIYEMRVGQGNKEHLLFEVETIGELLNRIYDFIEKIKKEHTFVDKRLVTTFSYDMESTQHLIEHLSAETYTIIASDVAKEFKELLAFLKNILEEISMSGSEVPKSYILDLSRHENNKALPRVHKTTKKPTTDPKTTVITHNILKALFKNDDNNQYFNESSCISDMKSFIVQFVQLVKPFFVQSRDHLGMNKPFYYLLSNLETMKLAICEDVHDDYRLGKWRIFEKKSFEVVFSNLEIIITTDLVEIKKSGGELASNNKERVDKKSKTDKQISPDDITKFEEIKLAAKNLYGVMNSALLLHTGYYEIIELRTFFKNEDKNPKNQNLNNKNHIPKSGVNNYIHRNVKKFIFGKHFRNSRVLGHASDLNKAAKALIAKHPNRIDVYNKINTLKVSLIGIFKHAIVNQDKDIEPSDVDNQNPGLGERIRIIINAQQYNNYSRSYKELHKIFEQLKKTTLKASDMDDITGTDEFSRFSDSMTRLTPINLFENESGSLVERNPTQVETDDWNNSDLNKKAGEIINELVIDIPTDNLPDDLNNGIDSQYFTEGQEKLLKDGNKGISVFGIKALEESSSHDETSQSEAKVAEIDNILGTLEEKIKDQIKFLQKKTSKLLKGYNYNDQVDEEEDLDVLYLDDKLRGEYGGSLSDLYVELQENTYLDDKHKKEIKKAIVKLHRNAKSEKHTDDRDRIYYKKDHVIDLDILLKTFEEVISRKKEEIGEEAFEMIDYLITESSIRRKNLIEQENEGLIYEEIKLDEDDLSINSKRRAEVRKIIKQILGTLEENDIDRENKPRDNLKELLNTLHTQDLEDGSEDLETEEKLKKLEEKLNEVYKNLIEIIKRRGTREDGSKDQELGEDEIDERQELFIKSISELNTFREGGSDDQSHNHGGSILNPPGQPENPYQNRGPQTVELALSSQQSQERVNTEKETKHIVNSGQKRVRILVLLEDVSCEKCTSYLDLESLKKSMLAI